jgi:hypothetical protein
MTEFSLTLGPHRLFGYRTNDGELLVLHDGPGVPSPLSLPAHAGYVAEGFEQQFAAIKRVLTTLSNA